MSIQDESLHFDKVQVNRPSATQESEQRESRKWASGKAVFSASTTPEKRTKLVNSLIAVEQYSELNESIIDSNGNLDIDALLRIAGSFYNIAKREQTKRRKAVKDLKAMQEAMTQIDGYQKWKEAQKAGRAPKRIDWTQYDLLVQAKANQKQIAAILGVSPNTLRKLVKERNNG